MMRRALASLLLVLVLVPVGAGLMPSRAHALFGAGDVVFDPANFVKTSLSAFFDGELNIKEYVLDPLAHMAAQRAVQSIVRTTVNWINSGFEGSPAYATNLKRDLQLLADQVANRFLSDLQAEGLIQSPFRDQLIDSIRQSYRRRTAQNAFFLNNQYDLNQVADNAAAFVNQGFGEGRGGLRAWVAAWQNDQNNIFGAYRAATSELGRRITSAQDHRQTELSWSNGVFSWCAEPAGSDTEAQPGATATNLTQGAPGGSDDCEIRTPGSVISDRLRTATNADIASLISADEIDEVIGALMSQLMNKMLGGSGLFGLSGSSSGSSGIDSLDADTNTTGGLSNSTNGVITNQLTQLGEFKTNLTEVKNAAQAALDLCDSNGGDATPMNYLRQVISAANTNISKADAAVAELQAIKTQLAATGPTASTQIREGLQRYEQFMSSGALPSAQAIADAAIQTQVDDSIEPTTVMTQIQNINQRLCRDT